MESAALARNGYSQASRQIKSARSIEYDVFARITSRLRRAVGETENFTELVAAMHENRELWTTLAVDLADSGNALPALLKARLLYLAEFTFQHTAKVLLGTADPHRRQHLDHGRASQSECRSMSGLVLKLGPHERVLINGAVIENGEKRSRLSIMTPNANILRLRDAIHPEEVNTPVRRLCYIAQLVLSGDAKPEEARHQLYRGIEQLAQALTDADSSEKLDCATIAVGQGQFYQALRSLRALLPREERLLGVVPT